MDEVPCTTLLMLLRESKSSDAFSLHVSYIPFFFQHRFSRFVRDFCDSIVRTRNKQLLLLLLDTAEFALPRL